MENITIREACVFSSAYKIITLELQSKYQVRFPSVSLKLQLGRNYEFSQHNCSKTVPKGLDCILRTIFILGVWQYKLWNIRVRGYIHTQDYIYINDLGNRNTRRMILDDVGTTIGYDGRSGCCNRRFGNNFHLCLDCCWNWNNSVVSDAFRIWKENLDCNLRVLQSTNLINVYLNLLKQEDYSDWKKILAKTNSDEWTVNHSTHDASVPTIFQ